MVEISRREQIANVTLAISYLYFFANNFAFLTYQFRWSVLFLAIFNLFLAVNAIFRRSPRCVSLAPFDIFITLMGTYSVTFMVGVGTQQEVLVLQILGGIGLLISLSGVLALNKSFGLLPADRGVIKAGIYRFIRHPIYAGYFISNCCFIVQNYSHWNLGCFTLFVIFEMLRLLREEKLLCQNPEYFQYTQETRWRIIPALW